MSRDSTGPAWLLYQAVLAMLLLIGSPILLARRGWRHYRPTLRGRMARDLGSPDGVRRLWVHAVSVGEVGVAATLVRRLPEDLPVVITTVTPTGQAQARRLLGERADVAYLPFDLGPPLERFLRRFEPRALLLVEGDYWPLALSKMAPRGPILVVNGRLSDRAFGRQRPLGRVNQIFYRHVASFGLQTEADRERLAKLGVSERRLQVTGNLKYDAPEPPTKPELMELLERAAEGRPILLAGSTMNGEEEAVLQAAADLGVERALLVVAPRHPERWDEVSRLMETRGLRFRRRTRLEQPDGAERLEAVLLDSLGELAGLYRLAAAAFIGGTLTETGGHNPLEPARFAIPTAVGPSMHNFKEMAERFDGEDAWARVEHAGQLTDVWRDWLENPDAAREIGRRGQRLVESNRGATRRTLDMILPYLDE